MPMNKPLSPDRVQSGSGANSEAYQPQDPLEADLACAVNLGLRASCLRDTPSTLTWNLKRCPFQEDTLVYRGPSIRSRNKEATCAKSGLRYWGRIPTLLHGSSQETEAITDQGKETRFSDTADKQKQIPRQGAPRAPQLEILCS